MAGGGSSTQSTTIEIPEWLQAAAQARDILLDRIVGQDVFQRRDRLHNRFFCHNFARSGHQKLQKCPFARWQIHDLSVGRELPAGKVQRQRPEAERGRPQPRLPPQQRPDTSLELAYVERFGHVVIGPQIKAAHPVFGGPARGQDHHGGAVVLRPHGAQHRQPVQLRQVQVKDHQVKLLDCDKVLCGLSVMDAVYRIAGRRQKRYQRLGQWQIVFDQQQSHEAPVTGG